VVGNDTDADGNSLSAVKVSDPANGTVTLNADGSFTYTPDANFNGADSFTYKANDGTADSNVATVNITVTDGNDAPVAVDDSATTAEDTPLTVAAPGVVGNDTDTDGNSLSAVKVSDPANGTVTVNADGSYTYTPNANFNGGDSFTYKANDGSADSNVATVNITVTAVNDAPVAVDDAYTTAFDTPITVGAPGVLANDTDAEGSTLTAGSASDPAGGSVTLSADGSFTYTPDPAFNGTDTFTYAASDGQGGSDVATVTIAVGSPTGPTTLTVGDLSLKEGNAGTTAATFTITRSGTNSGSSTVKYKTGGGTATVGDDYASVPLTGVTFGPGETSKAVTVNVVADTAPEPDETFSLILSTATGAAISDATGTATVVNDDGSAYLPVNSLTVTEGNGGTTPAAFTITRSGTTTSASTVTYKTSGGTATTPDDYTPVGPTSVTFAPGETSKAVTVAVVGDTTDETNQTFNLMLSAPTPGTVLSDASGTATIVDDDGPIVAGPSTFLAVGDLSVTEGSSGSTAADFTITRYGNTTGSSTVKYKTSTGTATAGSDYTSVSLTPVTFGPGETSKSVSVGVAADTVPEANETFTLVLSSPTAATIADASGTATILNDDAAAYLTVANISVTEGNSGTTPATFTITRSGNTTGSSTVKYKTTDYTAKAGADYTAVPLTSVTFGPGETTKTVTVDVIGDTVVEKFETFNLVLSSATGATISDSGTATIVNDD
jgi:VCBS repeat-containing protein